MPQEEAVHLASVYTFELPDRDGVSHQYECTAFGLEGINLVVEIRSMALEPLGRILSSASVLEAIKDRIQADGINTDLGAVFGDIIKAGIPWSEVARDVKSGLKEVGGGQLMRRILMKTYRDGKRLSDDRVFSRAYARNWNEMFFAAWRVAQWNEMPGFTFTSTEQSDEEEEEVGESPESTTELIEPLVAQV